MQTSSAASPGATTSRVVFWARLVQVLLFVRAAFSLVALAFLGEEYALLKAWQSGVQLEELTPAFEAIDARRRSIAIPYVGVFVLLVPFVSKWIHSANVAVRKLGAEGLENSPGWAVGWFFVPIAAYWRPYKAMRELWAASHNPYDWRGRSDTNLLFAWWMAWVLMITTSYIASKLEKNAEKVSEFIELNRTLVGVGVADVVAAVLLGVIVARITRSQSETEARQSTEPLLSLGGS